MIIKKHCLNFSLYMLLCWIGSYSSQASAQLHNFCYSVSDIDSQTVKSYENSNSSIKTSLEYFQDFQKWGGQGKIFIYTEENQKDMPEKKPAAFLVVSKLPDRVISDSMWIFLREQRTLDKLNKLMRKQKSLTLFLSDSSGDKVIGEVKRISDGNEFKKCLDTHSPWTLMISPALDYWTLLHELQHAEDVESGFVVKLRNRIDDISRQVDSFKYLYYTFVILKFVIEQRSYAATHEVRQRTSSKEMDLRMVFGGDESDFYRGAKIETVTRAGSFPKDTERDVLVLQSYFNNLRSVLLDFRKDPEALRKIIKLLRTNTFPSKTFPIDYQSLASP